MTPQDSASLLSGQSITVLLLGLNFLLLGWIMIRVRRDLADIKSSLKRIIQAVQPINSPEVIAPQVNTPDFQDQPQQAETILGPQAKSASNIVAFIAARQAGSSLQEAAQQYDLTEDEAFAISVSYRDAAPSPANNDAMS